MDVWIPLLSAGATAAALITFFQGQMKSLHIKIAERAVDRNNLERDLAHLRRSKEQNSELVSQLEGEVAELSKRLEILERGLELEERLEQILKQETRIDSTIARLARLEGTQRILLAERVGDSSFGHTMVSQ